jgi:hypothetical protein
MSETCLTDATVRLPQTIAWAASTVATCANAAPVPRKRCANAIQDPMRKLPWEVT